MFYSIRGKMIHKNPELVVIETSSGIGFSISTTLTTFSGLPEVGAEIMLFTHLVVRENDITLFGFARRAELEAFKMLTTVSGVGPKAATSILSQLTPEKFSLAIASGDEKALRSAQGVGPKSAQRIILELKDKVKNEDISAGITESATSINSNSDSISEAMNALITLGYSQSEAASALSKLDTDMKLEDLIKAALKKLAKK